MDKGTAHCNCSCDFLATPAALLVSSIAQPIQAKQVSLSIVLPFFHCVFFIM